MQLTAGPRLGGLCYNHCFQLHRAQRCTLGSHQPRAARLATRASKGFGKTPQQSKKAVQVRYSGCGMRRGPGIARIA